MLVIWFLVWFDLMEPFIWFRFKEDSNSLQDPIIQPNRPAIPINFICKHVTATRAKLSTISTMYKAYTIHMNHWYHISIQTKKTTSITRYHPHQIHYSACQLASASHREDHDRHEVDVSADVSRTSVKCGNGAGNAVGRR